MVIISFALSMLCRLTIRRVARQATKYNQHVADVKFTHYLIRLFFRRWHGLADTPLTVTHHDRIAVQCRIHNNIHLKICKSKPPENTEYTVKWVLHQLHTRNAAFFCRLETAISAVYFASKRKWNLGIISRTILIIKVMYYSNYNRLSHITL